MSDLVERDPDTGKLRWRPREPQPTAVTQVSEDQNWVLLANGWILERVPRVEASRTTSADPCATCFFRGSYSVPLMHVSPDEAREMSEGAQAAPRYCREALGLPPCEPGKPLILPRIATVTMSGAVFRKTPDGHARKVRERCFNG